MILRSLRLRHGRIALPKPAAPGLVRSWRRYTSSLDTSKEFVQSGSELQIIDARTGQRITVNDPNHPVAQDYAFHQFQKSRTQHLGAEVPSHYRPHELVTKPPSPKDITLELLMASQSHLGHSTTLWHPGNAAYIFGIRGEEDPIHIIGLDVTAAHLRRACKVVRGVAERGGLVLFVGTREGQARAVVKAAQLAKGCHLFTKWIPGSITNGQQILGRCDKKVVDEYDQEMPGFDQQLSKKAALKPDLVVCLNPLENYILLHECGLHSIPTIGIVDTDCNPTWVTYPIPANDDSLRCVQVIVGTLGRAGEEGQKIRLEKAKRGIVEYSTDHQLLPPSKTNSSRKTSRDRIQRGPSRAGATPAATSMDELNYPEDVVGVPVDQHRSDQVLLSQAEGAAFSRDEDVFSDIDADDVADAEFETSEEDPMHDPDGLDKSLIHDEATSSDQLTEDAYLDEDVSQFGGTPQHDDTTSPSSHLEGEGSSTWDQVGEVESELGEQAPDSIPPSDSEPAQPTTAATTETEEDDDAPTPPRSK